MASKAERLAPVVDMAAREEREATRRLGEAQAQLDQAQSRLGDLERYYDDYRQQWLSEGQRGVSGARLLNYQRFLTQLETAIAQQQRSVAWHRDNLEKLRQHWQQKHARLEGLRKLVERHLHEARVAADKREQNMLDEFCQRLAGRRK